MLRVFRSLGNRDTATAEMRYRDMWPFASGPRPIIIGTPAWCMFSELPKLGSDRPLAADERAGYERLHTRGAASLEYSFYSDLP